VNACIHVFSVFSVIGFSSSMTSASDSWTSAMRRGDFAEAWRICDAVLAERRGRNCSTWPRHLQYVWNGSPVDGRRVLVRCYHGLGDTIQFVRLLAPLRARARRVTLWVQPALIELLGGVRGADELLPLHDGAPHADYDVDVELMELPHVLRLSERDLPGEIPYIYVSHAAPSRASRLLSRASAGVAELRVGLAWRAGDWDRRRSIPEAAIGRLLQVPRVQWVSLQYPDAPPCNCEDQGCRDIRELGARMHGVDLVISADTMNAHLAGALGLPVWTLLPAECDWRWMTDRSDTPWYPTMRLFRQLRADGWDAVIDEVIDALFALARDARQEDRDATPARGTRSTGCTASSG
jgi:hypothetical protein